MARFLSTVWSKQPTGQAFLSTKDWSTGEWREHPVDHVNPVIPETGDIYFAPCLFTEQRRLRKYVKGGRWLYADLDSVHPQSLTDIGVTPTLAWQTSPDRYQALWLLDRPLRPRALEQLNQRLTYLTGADKGGWSLTKVLRVPHSTSTKYSQPFTVALLERSHKPVTYTVPEMTAILRDVTTPTTAATFPTPPQLTNLPDPQTLFARRRRRIPVRARQLLRFTPDDVLQSDDRSARLWELENLLLHEARLSPEETFVLVQHSAWNKYRGQRREHRALWTEIAKASANKHTTTSKATAKTTSTLYTSRNGRRLPTGALANTADFRSFLAYPWPEPTWLVDQMWMAGAFGLFPGEPKSYKTTILLDLAISVATGHKFLSTYDVPNPGTVCYIHEEGRQGHIKSLAMRILANKDINLVDHTKPGEPGVVYFYDDSIPIPLHITSYPSLNLLDDEDHERIENHIRAFKPKLVILETLYLLIGSASESEAAEMMPAIELISHLSRKYDTAIILSHHFHKASDDKRHMNRTSGSNIFLRSFESMLSTERIGDDEDHTIILRSHHREGLGTHTNLRISWDPDKEIDFKVEQVDDDEVIDFTEASRKQASRKGEIWRLMEEGLTNPTEIAETLGITEKTARKWIREKNR